MLLGASCFVLLPRPSTLRGLSQFLLVRRSSAVRRLRKRFPALRTPSPLQECGEAYHEAAREGNWAVLRALRRLGCPWGGGELYQSPANRLLYDDCCLEEHDLMSVGICGSNRVCVGGAAPPCRVCGRALAGCGVWVMNSRCLVCLAVGVGDA